MTPIRTSLQNVPSGITAEQLAARTKAAQAEAWGAGILLVRVDDPRLTWPERELVKQLGDKLANPTP